MATLYAAGGTLETGWASPFRRRMGPEMALESTLESPLLTWIDGVAHFRGLPVVEETLTIAGRTFRLAGLKDAADLLDHEDFAREFVEEDRAPYGLELWPAAPMLAEFILQTEPGEGRRAIEIGCGLGLVSMAAALAGWHVIATDNEATSLRFARYNAELNDVSIGGYGLLDWHKIPATANRTEPRPSGSGLFVRPSGVSSGATSAQPGGDARHASFLADLDFDRVFGADVLYQLSDHVPILSCVSRLLAPDGIALLADPCRSVADGFETLARHHGFEVEVGRTAATFRTRGRLEGRIFRLRFGRP